MWRRSPTPSATSKARAWNAAPTTASTRPGPSDGVRETARPPRATRDACPGGRVHRTARGLEVEHDGERILVGAAAGDQQRGEALVVAAAPGRCDVGEHRGAHAIVVGLDRIGGAGAAGADQRHPAQDAEPL